MDGFPQESREEEDAVRSALLRHRGYRVVRFTDAEVMSNLEGVAQAIDRALKNSPSPSPSRMREWDT